MSKNLLKSLALSALVCTGSVAVAQNIPDGNTWYRLVSHATTQDRDNTCIELVSDLSDGLHINANGTRQNNRLWSAAKAEDGAANLDYQYWQFVEDPANAGNYAMVCKAKPEGSVNSTPTAQANAGRWDYDDAAKHFDFQFVAGDYQQELDGVYSLAIRSTKQDAGWYMNIAAGGQGFAVNCYNDPTDGNGGLFYFEAAPVVVDYDLSSLGVRNNAGNRSERYLSSVVLSVNGGEEVTIGPISSSSDYSIYYDKHDQSFSAPAGAEVTVTLGGAGSWIHNYAYVDWASDGFNYSAPTDYVDLDTYLPLEGSDLVWYSCWRKSTSDSDPWKNSRGETVSNNQNTNGATYTFTIPADTPAGDYRMRVKTAWQSLDPNGKIDTSASNNTIQDNGGTIVDFTLTVTEAAVVEPAHTYMYFEANRKAGWGSYLQDANEPVQGSYASSTLCGSEILTANCVWEITPGTVDGAVHVQNFVTKKYLVNLVDGGGSTTLDEPINIWFHDFSWDGKNGIQIGTGATVNGNCLDQDNHDSLVGIWANDAGNLWFKTTMDATTPEEVEAFFNEGEDPRVAVIQQKIDDTKALCELYKVSAPMAAETINELMTAFEAFTPEYVLEQGLYDELDEMIASAVVTPVEEAVVAALNESLAGNYYWTLQGMRRANANMASYLSGGVKENTSAGWASFVPVKTPTDGTDWSLISNGTEGQFIMQNVSTSKYIGTPAVHYCKVVDTPEEAGAFTFGVRDGYVIFNSVAHPGKGLSFDSSATDPVEIFDVLTDIGAIWAVSVSTERGQEDPRVAEVREKLNAAFALADLYKESVPMAAEAIEEGIGSLRGYSAEFIVSNNISDAMLNSLLQQAQSEVEKAVTTALNDNIEGNYWTLYEPMQPGYLSAVNKATNKGYSSFNFQAEVDKDTRWTLVPATDGQFKMLSNKGQYIGTPGQTYCKVVDSADEAGLFTFGIKEGYVNFLPVAFPGCALGLDCQNDPVEIMSLEDGSNGYRWQVSVATIPAGGDHTYMYFEANRKAGWGSYLQDADEIVQGSYKSSSLCGSDTLNINCVWEITPGTVDGAYHVQNFVTKKYLVNLEANGSTTIDEPINIWFHDLTYDGKTGIQIGTGASVNNNCLDQDNHDSLVGQWANDAGNLWFPTTMDATTPEEVYAHFGVTPPPAVSLIDVFCNRIDQIKEICARYLESVPFAGEEATVRIGALDQIKSAAAIYLMECTNEEEAIAAANRVALEPVEKALLADINADITSSAYVLYNTSLNGYLSSSYNYNDGSFVTLSELNAGCMWGFNEDGNITALNSAQTMMVSKNYTIGGFCGPWASDCKQPLTLSFGLKNGYVVVNASNVSGGFLSYDGGKFKVLDNTANGLWKIQKLSAADFKEAFTAQLTTWGGNVPGGAAIVEEGLAQVEAAADLSAVSAAGVAVREALLATLAPSEKAVTLKNIGTNGYLGYEFGWFTQEEANEGAEFEFVSKSGATDRYVLLNKQSGMYICVENGALAGTETLESALNFVFMLHNNGHVVIRCAQTPPGNQNALCVKEDGELSYGNENNAHQGEASAYYCWSIVYAGEQSGDNEEKLAEINLRLEGVKALAESYAKHVPFAADAINELLPVLEEATAEELLEYYDVIDAWIQEYMIDPIEDTVVASAQENAGKPWTLYQPGQGAYLGCEAKATNQGWNSFNYQAEANYTGYWTAVKVADGIYVMKSADGKFIGTPKAHYCRVEESQDEAGEFSIVAKEGYIVFNSIAHPGNSLGLDGKNDPVEIMSSEDGSRGYLWQVDLYTGDLYETVSISEIEAIADDAVIYDLQGRRVKNVSTGLYIVNGVKTMIRK